MAQKFSSATTAVSLNQVKARLALAVRDGRFMQALDLAKQVYKAEPNAANQQGVLNAYLGRGRQLRGQNKMRDAVTTLQNAIPLIHGDPARLDELAEEFAACGEVRQALQLLQQHPEAPAHAKVLGRAADAAIQQEAKGRTLLPEELRGDFDRTLQAFAQTEAGQDDAARDTLHAISFRSPFLEWKLFLRGLQAYYQSDDARAIENWQRLTADRLPARLAAPLRARIDSIYRLAQPPEAQAALRRQADRLQDEGLAPHLRSIQAALAGGGRMTAAFRLAETLLPALRQQAPDLVPRLAAAFYWAIIIVGVPDDVPQYQRVFGPPPDDPEFHRLQGLACERHHGMQDAQNHWAAYEKSIAANPTAWPGDGGRRARALLWLHMGRNAARVIDPSRIPNLPRFLRQHPDRPRPLKPSADKCFRNSIKLAPDLLAAHEALIAYHQERGKLERAEKAARDLLKRFPEHGPTLETLADLLVKSGSYPEALELFERARGGRPLERELREKISTAHTFNARALTEAGRFEEARAAYRAALEEGNGRDESSLLCKWAACELKAGDKARADELIGQALQQNGSRLVVAYEMLIETIRLKLPRPLKGRFDKEFKELLAETPTAAAVVGALQIVAAHQAAGVEYVGRQTHEKKVLAYTERARKIKFTEEQLASICANLVQLQSIRTLRAYCKLGAARFPHAAVFPYLHAESYLLAADRPYDAWQAKPFLATAHRLASEMPHDERRTEMLEAISTKQKLLDVLEAGPFGFLGGDFDPLDDFDDEDDWDDDGW